MTREENNKTLLEIFKKHGVSNITLDLATNTVKFGIPSVEVYDALRKEIDRLLDSIHSTPYTYKGDRVTGFDLKIILNLVDLSMHELSGLNFDTVPSFLRKPVSQVGVATFKCGIPQVSFDTVDGVVYADGSYIVHSMDKGSFE